jgi:hypothetical protein
VTRLRANAAATIARSWSAELDLPAGCGGCLREGDRDRCPDVLPPPGTGSATAEAPSEELLQNVVESPELGEQISTAEDFAVVVSGLPLWVGEHFIGLGDFAKASLGRRIIRVCVRMGLAGEPTKRVLDLL